MAKKKTARKIPTPKKTSARASRKSAPTNPGAGPRGRSGNKAHAAATAKARVPVDRKLPGMTQPQNVRLDLICEGLSEQRDVINNAKREEKSSKAAALQEMLNRNYSVYKHAGIELSLVPGADTLRVHVIKQDGDLARGEGDETTDEVDLTYDAPNSTPDDDEDQVH